MVYLHASDEDLYSAAHKGDGIKGQAQSGLIRVVLIASASNYCMPGRLCFCSECEGWSRVQRGVGEEKTETRF